MPQLTCNNGHHWIDSNTEATQTGKCPMCGSESKVDPNAEPRTLDVPSAAFFPSESDSEHQPTLMHTGATGDAKRTQSPVGGGTVLPGVPGLATQNPHMETIDVPSGVPVQSALFYDHSMMPATRISELQSGNKPLESAAEATRQSELPPTDVTRDIQGPEPQRIITTVRKTKLQPIYIPGYEILGELGRGGMGVVYKANQIGLNRLVAIKMILAGTKASRQEIARFQIEAKASAKLHHPNIVQVYEVGEQEGCPFFSLEFLDGDSLSRKTGGNPQPPREAALLMQQLARAMDFAHRQGIIHRDLKPANILMSSDGTPKITDFGLAKQIDDDDGSGQTRTGAILGTPSYMAPEQAEGKTKECGPAADIYSLGAMFYDLLTGRPPFKGATVLDTLQQVRNVEPAPLTRVLTTVPKDLETICLKCLQKDPIKRYLTAGDLAEDLQRWLVGEPIQARPTPLHERVLKWAKRRPAAAALIAVLGLGASVLAIGGPIVARSQYNLRTIAEEQKEKAEKALIEANFHAGAGRRAVKEMLEKVAREKLVHEPRFEQVKRELLERALVFYDDFVSRTGADTDLSGSIAAAWFLVGDLREQLGERDLAAEAYKNALAQLPKVDPATANSPEFRSMNLLAKDHLGIIMQAQGKRQEAAALFGEAIADGEELAKEHTGNAHILRDLAGSYNNRGNLNQASTQFKEAEADYARALQIYAKLSEENKDTGLQVSYGSVQNNLAVLYTSMGKPKAAEEAYRDAIGFFEKLLAKKYTNPEYRIELARAYLNMGILRQRQQQPGKALLDYSSAQRICEKLTEQYPGISEYAYALATIYGNLALLQSSSGSSGQALLNRDKSIKLLRELGAAAPDEPSYQADLARGLGEWASIMQKAQKPKEAETALLEAHAIQIALRAKFPDDDAYQNDLACTLDNLGILMAGSSRPGNALRHFEDAVGVSRGLVKKQPTIAAYKELAVGQLSNLARQQNDMTRSRDALLSWNEAANLRRELARDFPANPAYQGELGLLLTDWSALLLELDLPAQALPLLEEAIASEKKAMAAAPKDPNLIQGLCVAHLFMMNAEVKLGHDQEVSRLAIELLRIMPADWPESRRIARLLAQCLALVDADKTRSNSQKEDRKHALTEQTIAVLRNGLESKTIKQDYVAENADLDPLRARPEFKRFLTELKRK